MQEKERESEERMGDKRQIEERCYVSSAGKKLLQMLYVLLYDFEWMCTHVIYVV